MSFNALKAFRRYRIARAIVGLLVLAGAAFAEYKLANIQRPVELKDTGKFDQATIRLGQELIFEGPVVNSEEGMLFSHDGKKNLIIDVSFDRARLGVETIRLLESLGPTPPSDPTTVDYQAQEPKSSAAGGEPCRTQVKLSAAQKKMPDEIHIFQFGGPSENHYPHLAIRTTGAELVSRLFTTAPYDPITAADASKRAPGCQSVLKVGDWFKSVSKTPVKIVVTEDSALRLSFKPRTSLEPPPWNDTGGVLPFDLGTERLPEGSPPFRVHSVNIKSLDTGKPHSFLSAESTKNGPLLTIRDLKIGSDQIQLTIAGTGWVKIDGEPWTVNFLNRLMENKILAALLAAANAALLALVARLIFKTPSTKPVR